MPLIVITFWCSVNLSGSTYWVPSKSNNTVKNVGIVLKSLRLVMRESVCVSSIFCPTLGHNHDTL